MVRALAHRGPDDRAVVTRGDATFGVARLSIVDRAAGGQPMTLEAGGGSGLIAYNGEVYNFLSLRERLLAEGVALRTRSDTEAVLGAHLTRGQEAVESFDGMFAYAVWEEPRAAATLARDPLGIKPLYYAEAGDSLVFASEPKAVFCDPRVECRPDLTAALEYFLHGAAFAAGYSTGARSFYAGVKSVPPGHLLRWSARRGASVSRYWSPVQEFGSPGMGEGDAREALADSVARSVRSMMMGEVPVGTALSGGLDSSLITAEAARSAPRPLVSACITYRDDRGDEDARHAALLSRDLNLSSPGSHRLDYTHLRESTYLDRLDEMIRAFDEPHWEPRQLAMFDNYRTLARAGRTVVLTGEGADELFFGYYRKFPGFRTPELSGPRDFADLWRMRLPLVRELLSPAFASGLVSDELAHSLIDEQVAAFLAPAWEETGDRLRAVQCWYLHTFLPWLLLDNDRCSMAHGIEGRFPFLSRELVSLALRLPPSWNVADEGAMQEKVLLRRAAASRLPEEIWRDRVKAPLPVPDAASYHKLIARRLKDEAEAARPDVWAVLDRRTVFGLLGEFDARARATAEDDGERLTSYIPLGAEPRVRTAQLFGILTFLRWFDLCIPQTGKDSRWATQ